MIWGYAFILDFTGFVIATFAFQATAFFCVFNKRSPLWLIGVPFVLTSLFTVFFDRILSVPLPRGVGLFYTVNSFLV